MVSLSGGACAGIFPIIACRIALARSDTSREQFGGLGLGRGPMTIGEDWGQDGELRPNSSSDDWHGWKVEATQVAEGGAAIAEGCRCQKNPTGEPQRVTQRQRGVRNRLQDLLLQGC